jgi:hypothetical protein
VRVGDGFGLRVFWLDWSEALELRDQVKKLDYAWVVLTGRLKPPGPDYVAIGYSGTVTVKTFQVVGLPLPRRKQQPAAKSELAPPFAVEVGGAILDVPHKKDPPRNGPLYDNANPWFGDFDGDGKPDLLVGQGGFGSAYPEGGRLQIYKNLGEKGRPRFGDPHWFDDHVPTGCIPTG